MCKANSFFLLALFFAFLSPAFSQSEAGESVSSDEIAQSSQTESAGSDFDDFDSLFENAEDTDEAVITDEERAGTTYNVQVGAIKFPIEVSGTMNTDLGGAFIYEDGVGDATFYFDFKNYLYFTVRPDTYLALKGVVKTTMPKDSADTESEQNSHLLYLYEMYFDYLLLDRIYITAGKKKSVWGNIRLFSDYYDESENISSTDSDETSDTIDTNVNDAKFTNILYDSREYISGIVKVPFGNHTFTALAMYNDETNVSSTKTERMSLAGSLEFIVFNTSINFMGRRFRLKNTDDNLNAKQLPIVGMEVKRTILNFDVYGQSLLRIQDGKSMGDIFTSKFDDLSSLNRIVSTVGTYRLWSENAPYVGFNFEFQNIYRPEPSASETFSTNRFAFEFGMAKLGPDRNIKPAIQWNHNITDKSGFFKAGIVFSRVLPHCDWRFGAKYEYGKVSKDETTGETHTFSKLTVGTYIRINLDY